MFDIFQKFTEGYCNYEGSLLENLGMIKTADQCQLACEFNDNCNYFVYNYEQNNCQLLKSSERTCDLIRGPATPTYAEACIDLE